MVTCPVCGKAAMSYWQKSALGPGRVVRCQSCGRPVATHWLAIFAAIPAFVGGYVFLNSTSTVVGAMAVVGGVLSMALIQTFVIPLVNPDA